MLKSLKEVPFGTDPFPLECGGNQRATPLSRRLLRFHAFSAVDNQLRPSFPPWKVCSFDRNMYFRQQLFGRGFPGVIEVQFEARQFA